MSVARLSPGRCICAIAGTGLQATDALFRFEIWCNFSYSGIVAELGNQQFNQYDGRERGKPALNRERQALLNSPELSLEEAEVIALKALAFLANDVDRLDRFLALSGVSPGNIRLGAADPRFQAGILNHLLQDESLLLTFAADADIDPRLPALAAGILDGRSD